MSNRIEKTKLRKKIAKLQEEIKEEGKNLVKLKFAYQPFIKHPVSYFEKKLSTTTCPEILLEEVNPEDVSKRFFNYYLNNKEPTSFEGVLMVAGSCRFPNLVKEIKNTLEEKIATAEETIAEKQRILFNIKQQNAQRPSGNYAKFFIKRDSAEELLSEVTMSSTVTQ